MELNLTIPIWISDQIQIPNSKKRKKILSVQCVVSLCNKLYPQHNTSVHSSLPVFPNNTFFFFFFFSLFSDFDHHPFMYAAEVFRVFAVRGGNASPAVAPTTNCLKIAAFSTPTFRNSVNARWAKALTLCRCSVDSKSSVGDEVFSVTQSNKSDVDYLGESTKGDLNVKLEHLEAFGKTWNFFFLQNSRFFTSKVSISSFYCILGCVFFIDQVVFLNVNVSLYHRIGHWTIYI